MKSSSYLNETLTDPKKGPSAKAEDAPFQTAHNIPFFPFYDKVCAYMRCLRAHSPHLLLYT